MKTGPNQRNTVQRQVILEELRAVNSHPTATELYEMVRKQLPKVSLGTVYRNLELLAQSKTIRKLELTGSEAHFDGETRPHHHARCQKCGAIDDLWDIPNDIVQQQHMSLADYDLRGYRIDFYGLCRACKSGQADSENKEIE